MVHLRVVLEPLRRQCHELRNSREIPVGVLNLAVPKVRGQFADVPVDILSVAVPLQQLPDCKGMPQPVYPRIPAPIKTLGDLSESHEDFQVLERCPQFCHKEGPC